MIYALEKIIFNMKHIFVLVAILFIFAKNDARAYTECFIAVENDKVIEKIGNCENRYPPCSTFKVPLALMGYDSGILKNEKDPVWKFKKGYPDFLEVWKEDHDPKKWLKNSCIWFSQVLTKKMGEEKFSNYVNEFKYGNMDVSGDNGKNNGLTNCWLSSSLKISPNEQIEFLNKMLTYNLPISRVAHEKALITIEKAKLPNNWYVYGKTGSGHEEDVSKKIGWFIGWIQNEDRKIIFVHLEKGENVNGIDAKREAKKRLLKIIN